MCYIPTSSFTDARGERGVSAIEGDIILFLLAPSVLILVLWFIAKQTGYLRAGMFAIRALIAVLIIYALFLFYLWIVYPVPVLEPDEEDWDYPFLVVGVILATTAAATAAFSGFFAIRNLKTG